MACVILHCESLVFDLVDVNLFRPSASSTEFVNFVKITCHVTFWPHDLLTYNNSLQFLFCEILFGCVGLK